MDPGEEGSFQSMRGERRNHYFPLFLLKGQGFIMSLLSLKNEVAGLWCIHVPQRSKKDRWRDSKLTCLAYSDDGAVR